jgi:hypothetical protein
VANSGSFKKGNKAATGRKPKPFSLTLILRDKLGQLDPATQRQRAELVVEAAIQKAINGDMKAIEAIFDRIDGPIDRKEGNAAASDDTSALRDYLAELKADRRDGSTG